MLKHKDCSALKGDDERAVFAFPDIYRQWKGPIKTDGPNVDIKVFSFMTTLPNALQRACRPSSVGVT